MRTEMYYYALSQKAGALRGMGENEQANREFIHVFTNSVDLKKQAYMKPTRDIAQGLGAMKQSRQRLVGFALETHDELAHAQDKLARKNFDFIVLNSLQDEGAGFQHDTNKITIVTPETAIPYPLKPKTEVAADIIDQLATILPN